MSQIPQLIYETIPGTTTIFNTVKKEFISGQYFQNRELLKSQTPINPSSTQLTFTNEELLWQNVNAHRFEAVKVSLNDFYLMEWIPQSPGLFFTRGAELARRTALMRIKEQKGERIIFDPWGKSEMIKGGIGCLRLSIKNVGEERIKFLSATSSGIAHRGFLVAMRESDYRDISQSLSMNGGIRCSLEGTLYYWNSAFKFPFYFGEEIPRVYLSLDRISDYSNNPIPPGAFNVTAAVIFSHTDQGKSSSADVIHWTYSQFDPSISDSIQKCSNWMRIKYVQSMYQGRILTDFDEMVGHFPDASLPLKILMDPSTDPRIIGEFTRNKLGILDPSFIQNVEKLVVVEHMIDRHVEMKNSPGGTVVAGDNSRVIIGNGYKVTINEKLTDTDKFGNLGEEMAHLRGEISALQDLPEKIKNQSIHAVQEVEDEVADKNPDPSRIEEGLKRVKSILDKAGETYEAGKPWVDRFKSVGNALVKYLPMLGMTIAALI